MWGDSVVFTASVPVCGGKDRRDGVSERGKREIKDQGSLTGLEG